MCDCLHKYTEEIIEKTGDPGATLVQTACYDEKNHKLSIRLVIPATYRKKNKNGEFNKRQSKTGFMCLYCPFCGEKK